MLQNWTSALSSPRSRRVVIRAPHLYVSWTGRCDLTVTSITSLVDDDGDDDHAYAGSCGLHALGSDRLLERNPQNRLVSTDKDALRWMERTEQPVNQVQPRRIKLAKGLSKPIQCQWYHTIPG